MRDCVFGLRHSIVLGARAHSQYPYTRARNWITYNTGSYGTPILTAASHDAHLLQQEHARTLEQSEYDTECQHIHTCTHGNCPNEHKSSLICWSWSCEHVPAKNADAFGEGCSSNLLSDIRKCWNACQVNTYSFVTSVRRTLCMRCFRMRSKYYWSGANQPLLILLWRKTDKYVNIFGIISSIWTPNVFSNWMFNFVLSFVECWFSVLVDWQIPILSS